MQKQIVEAIRSKKKMEIDYKGEGNRLVCPHSLYISSSGKTLVDPYQISGFSNYSEEVSGWRDFDLSKIVSLRVLKESFHIAPGYNSSSERYVNAIAKV
jgi:predicted DNA-binding transcriptional regulator YafY